MITPAYVRTVAAYNSEMKRRLYEPTSRLPRFLVVPQLVAA